MRNTLILGLILLLGLLLRIYNLNFPSIGYHNMKENEYLSIASEMQSTQDFKNKSIYFYNAFGNNPGTKPDPQPPLVSYQILMAWSLLGENIWAPRLFNVMFGVLSILVVYFICRLLFNPSQKSPSFSPKDECTLFSAREGASSLRPRGSSNIKVSLFGACLLAILPLAVFFSRNIQPESPAFFFMLLGNLFYLMYLSSFKRYNLMLAGLSLSVAWLYKFAFLIGVLPAIFCLLFAAGLREKREIFKSVALFLLPYSVILISILWLSHSGQWALDYKFRLFDIFHPSYWKDYGEAISWYIKGENYTFNFSLLAACGICLAIFKNKELLDRYIIGWVLSILVYAMLFPAEIRQNGFSQMPFLGLVCVSCAYAVFFIAEEINKFVKKDILVYLMFFVLVCSIPAVNASIARMHGTVFLGEDVAGETLKEFTSPSERIFLFTHPQGYAIARYAQRYVGWPDSLEDFKEKEKKYNVRFVCIYPGEYVELLKKDSPETFDYIEKNYRVKEIGLIESPNKLGYLILEKGNNRGRSIRDALESVSGKMQPRGIYRVSGKLVFVYAIRPVDE